MALVPDHVPTYIKQTVDATPKKVITADRWNELFNLLITQGDNNATALNDLLVALAATTAAANIGADIPSVVTKNVQAILDVFEAAIADRYTIALADAATTAATNNLVESVVFNEGDGTFTITKRDGTVSVIDTLLEKVPVNMVFETVGDITQIKITDSDGSTSTADVTSLVDNYNFNNTDTVNLNVLGTGNQKTISADVRDNSITVPKLAVAAITQLEGYRDAAAISAGNAAASDTSAEAHKNAAALSEGNAGTSETNANNSAIAAANSETNAQASEAAASGAVTAAQGHRDAALASSVVSESYAVGGTGTRPGEDTDNAQYYSNLASSIVGQKVTTFNGREGIVLPEAGDYNAAQVGAAPTSHTSADTTYGKADGTNYGHIRLAEGTTLTHGVFDGYAATPNSVKLAKDAADTAQATANNKADTNHASLSTTYGTGGSVHYGHLKLNAATNSTSGVTDGTAATPSAVKEAYDKATSTLENDTLLSASWVGSSAPYTYTKSITGITATSPVEILPGAAISATELEALQGANIVGGTQATNSITLKAFGEKPSVNIPVQFIIRRDL